MNFNLIDQISKLDKKRIENYIYLYGTKKDFIGIDEWLKYWNSNKIKMYKLLGNQLIYKAPFKYKKSSLELEHQLRNLIHKEDSFPNCFKEWLSKDEVRKIFPDDVLDYMIKCCSLRILVRNYMTETLKFKLEGHKSTLQFQSYMKPIRALNKFLTYCKGIEEIEELNNLFEEFRLAHSMIYNDNEIKGNLVISIHPLDYITMSDNNSNWQSCMSWTDSGCYRVGTIEMLNSNNVLCCYIENSDSYYFSKDQKDEEYRWTNKKWRELVYFTKDIIVCGKPYPYSNDEISIALINTIRDLASKNLHWTYNFGPELYKDMKYINGAYSMNRAKSYIHKKDMKKHNILFDTKGMYNDMLNDSYTNYWCVRNKVNHNKIISYSGKAPCLCCGNSIIYNDDYYESESYNDRYRNTNSAVCEDCLTKIECNFCHSEEPNKKHYMVYLENGDKVQICENCIKDFIRKCPDCGKTMLVSHLYGLDGILEENDIFYPEVFIKIDSDLNTLEAFHAPYHRIFEEKVNACFKTMLPICRCGKCAKKDNNFECISVKSGRSWTNINKEILISKEVENRENWEKYLPFNLESVEVCDGEIIVG